ncbi:MAG: hypothetical protein PSV46_02270 [Reyranella sp.]|nr:hypothetical protein [Reyranella sp.]
MSGKSIVIAIALAGWFVAALVAFVIVALFDFLGIGLIGLLIAFVASQLEMDGGGIAGGGTYGASMIHHQLEVNRKMSPEQRAASRNEQSLAALSTRFFRYFGISLAVIGFGGFAYRYL